MEGCSVEQSAIVEQSRLMKCKAEVEAGEMVGSAVEPISAGGGDITRHMGVAAGA